MQTNTKYHSRFGRNRVARSILNCSERNNKIVNIIYEIENHNEFYFSRSQTGSSQRSIALRAVAMKMRLNLSAHCLNSDQHNCGFMFFHSVASPEKNVRFFLQLTVLRTVHIVSAETSAQIHRYTVFRRSHMLPPPKNILDIDRIDLHRHHRFFYSLRRTFIIPFCLFFGVISRIAFAVCVNRNWHFYFEQRAMVFSKNPYTCGDCVRNAVRCDSTEQESVCVRVCVGWASRAQSVYWCIDGCCVCVCVCAVAVCAHMTFRCANDLFQLKIYFYSIIVLSRCRSCCSRTRFLLSIEL